VRVVIYSFALFVVAICWPIFAEASGPPALQVKELSTKGATSPVDYLNALNRRGPMLATCYGSKDALTKAAPIEAFLDVSADGLPNAVNITNVQDPTNGELSACLVKQLDKVRFPAADGVVEVKVLLGPAPPPKKDRPTD